MLPPVLASFVCTEGNFGLSVGVSLCGNYHFGGNFIDESTIDLGSGYGRRAHP